MKHEIKKSLSEISDVWCSDVGSDKSTAHSYTRIYEELFSQYRERDIKILEVGIKSGSSLRMWEEYFSKNSQIIGVDLAPPRSYQVNLNFKNITTLIGDATDENFMSQFNDLDIFIDDGSHNLIDQVKTMNIMKPLMKNGSLYIIEDVGTFEKDFNECITQLNLNCDSNGEIIDLRTERPNEICNALYVIKY